MAKAGRAGITYALRIYYAPGMCCRGCISFNFFRTGILFTGWPMCAMPTAVTVEKYQHKYECIGSTNAQENASAGSLRYRYHHFYNGLWLCDEIALADRREH